jgi:hypothetical protein
MIKILIFHLLFVSAVKLAFPSRQRKIALRSSSSKKITGVQAKR